MPLGALVPARFHGTRAYLRAQRTWIRARWRADHFLRSTRMARQVDRPIRFVLEQLRVTRHATVDYVLQGRTMRITHNTHAPEVFHEVFVDRYYDYAEDVPSPRRVADLGGNVGMFAVYASIRWPGVEVVAFEPDPANASKYRWMLQRNQIAGELVEACAATASGTVTFSGEESLAHVTADGTGVHRAAVDVFPYLSDVDLIKIDIEGSEWPLLLDERFAALPARVLVMEYHQHLCPEPDPKALAIKSVRAAGYDTIESIFHNDSLGVGMLRALKQSS